MSKLDELKAFTEEVKRRAEGRWDIVASHLMPELQPAMAKAGRMVFCPFHQTANKGAKKFRVKGDFAKTGMMFCTCFNGGEGAQHVLNQYLHTRNVSFTDAIQNIANVIVGMTAEEYQRTNMTPQRIEADRKAAAEESAKLIEGIRRIWNATLSLDAPEALPARLYLRRRWVGTLGLPIQEVRFHPRLYRSLPDDKHEYLPAMVGIIRRPDGKVSTVHRMWVTPDGRKAPGDEPRMMYPVPPSHPLDGSAIRLDEAIGPVINVCEGFETALSVRSLTGQPTWSCVSTWGLSNVVLPAHVRVVTVWADRDRSGDGEKAAARLVERLRAEGRQAMMFLPPFPIADGAKGVDWNDVMQDFAKSQVATYAVRQGLSIEQAMEKLNAEQPALGLNALKDHFAIRQWRAAQASALQAVAQPLPSRKTG